MNIKFKKLNQLKRKYNLSDNIDWKELGETIRQMLQAKAQRLRRCKKRANFFKQNKQFNEDAKKFYRQLGKKDLNVDQPPAIEHVEQFWAEIWENKKDHNPKAPWLDTLNIHVPNHEQNWSDITVQEIEVAVKSFGNWKSPGTDAVQNFWLKHLTSLHKDLAAAFTVLVADPQQAPEWLTSGVTYLLPKNEQTNHPKNYRPITCLPTIYKALTSVLTNRIYDYLIYADLLPAEQKGCKRGSYGCKDQLLINKLILEHCKQYVCMHARRMYLQYID